MQGHDSVISKLPRGIVRLNVEGPFGLMLNVGVPLSFRWLVFSDPGFEGMLAVLETGVYPFPETWGFPSPFVGSLRPLKMVRIKPIVHCRGRDEFICYFLATLVT